MNVLVVLRKTWIRLFPDENDEAKSARVKHIPGLLTIRTNHRKVDHQVKVKSGRQSCSPRMFGFSSVGWRGFSSQASSSRSKRPKVLSRMQR